MPISLSCRTIMLAVCVVATLTACSSSPNESRTDATDIPGTTDLLDVAAVCLGSTCSTVSDCAQAGPCVSSVSCVEGCCVRTMAAAGTSCSVGCQIEGTCSGSGECLDTQPKECPEEDGNPCTVATCNSDTGECGAEIPLPDGSVALNSNCWENLLCQSGEPDSSNATLTELNISCQQADEELDPFGCVAQVICVDSSEDCVDVPKDDGAECWTTEGGTSEECVGHSCSGGECVKDDTYGASCGEDDLPEACDEACRLCTELTCHWIPDPDASGDAKKRVRYCKASAMAGEPCEDGSDCSVDDVCVLDGQTNGPLGKETLGRCEPGEGKGKEDCLEELNKPALPCLVAGVTCTDEDGCHIDQDAADEWCYPPASVCFDKDGTYCTHLDPADGQWNEETGCHTELLDVDCDDQNECTLDKCKVTEEDVACEHNPVEGAACDDDDPCTVQDLCVEGMCVGNEKCIDEDDNPCTMAGCDEEGTCLVVPDDGVACDDGTVCTQTDTCQDGQCIGSAPLDCDDGEVCTADSCDAVAGCQHVPADGACDDGNACTVEDACTNGECVPGAPLDCDDGNVCTDDSCDPNSGCMNVDNTAACDDGDACTADDVCDAGSCSGAPVECDDGNPCTDDSCDPTSGCVFTNNTLGCDDNDACTTEDKCVDGACVGSVPPDCDDANVCTDDSCDPKSGCMNTNNTVGCDDNDACTTVDQCEDGVCVGSVPPDCDDDNICTDDYCDPEAGCMNASNTVVCDDNDACTTADVCEDGFCVGSGAPNCDDGNVCTDDSCDSAAGCVNVNNTVACDDNNACTTVDQCVDGACIGSVPPDCDDDNACTDDSCDPAVGCVNVDVDDGTLCSDGPEWQCLSGTCSCIPQCDGMECGDDLCGGSCGECDEGFTCDPATGICQADAKWSIVFSDDFEDGNAGGWSTPNGCAGQGCPYVNAQNHYYMPADWNSVATPAFGPIDASTYAIEFDLMRGAGFGRLLMRWHDSGIVKWLSIRHVEKPGGPVVNGVYAFENGIPLPLLDTSGTNHWRFEHDVSTETVTISVDGSELGQLPLPASADVRFAFATQNTTGFVPCNSWLDNIVFSVYE